MKIYDFIGVGFGPANLSTAVSMEENGLLKKNLNIAFIESKSEFSWHSGMLLPNAEMQISFFKDLAMLRNPTSKFTFLNYLSEKGRLESFANLKRFFPYRIEYNDYLKWAADQFNSWVMYGERVVKVEPFRDATSSVINYLVVHKENISTGETSVIYTKNLSLATGIRKKLPINIDVQFSNSVIHSNDFLKGLDKSFQGREAEYSFLVVGSGQSSAEVTMHLADRYPNSKIKMCLRGYALKPADETEFVNEIFSSQAAKEFLQYNNPLKKKILNAHRDTNYSVVDPELISILYERLYTQKITGNHQIEIKNFHELCQINGKEKTATFYDLKQQINHKLSFDGLILATGYDSRMTDTLHGFQDLLKYETPEKLVLDENYTVKTKSNGFLPKIFVQGDSEHSHGLGETLLSLLAYRSEKIVRQLITHNNFGHIN